MFARAIAVSFALAAVLPKLIVADGEKGNFHYTCEEFKMYLQNESLDLIGTKPDTTIKAIRNVDIDGCKAKVKLALVLASECKLSQYDENLSSHIAHYVETCGSGEYWTPWLTPSRSEDDRSKLDSVFSDEFFELYQENHLRQSKGLYFELDTEEIMLMIENIFQEYGGPTPMPETQVLQPCEEFVNDYEIPMVWISRAMYVVSDSKSYLKSLTSETQREYLQYELCKYILERPSEFEDALFSNFKLHDLSERIRRGKSKKSRFN